VHRNSRKILKAAHELEHILGRESSLSELATYLQIPIENLDRMMLDTKNSKIISFEEIGLGEDLLELTLIKENNPCHLAQHQEEKNNIVSLLRHLSERERLAIGLYYQEELTLKTIGHMLDISESRVSQIISQAIASLKQEWSLSFLNAAG
jgi:RNA polymerase sigma factor for flagellar operon FliA